MRRTQLRRWVDAGLLSQEQAHAIAAYEENRHKPWLTWAAFGIAGLAIALGIAAIIAANWADIPRAVKLGVHFMLNIAAAAGVFFAARRASPLLLDFAAFIFAALILTGIALIGQVFQLSSPLWRPLLFWTALVGPVLMLVGQGRLTAIAWCAGLLGSIVSFIADSEIKGAGAIILYAAVGPALIFTGMMGRQRSARHDYWSTFVAVGYVVILGVASLHAALIWGYDGSGAPRFARNFWSAFPVLAVVYGALAAFLFRRDADERARSTLLVAALAVMTLPTIGRVSGDPGQVLSAALFMALWAVVAWTCIKTRHPGLARLAVGIIALRLIAVYFQVFGSLAMTGLGLIVSGVLILIATYVSLRIMRRLAPADAAP